MSNNWDPKDPLFKNGQPNREEVDKRLEELRKVITQGASGAQERLKRVVDKASDYWQNTQAPPTPRESATIDEQRIRQLANMWSNENWRVAKDLGNYMDVISWQNDEVWEVTVQTRWETRTMEASTEPYTGRATANSLQPILPVWDYELPEVTSLKAAPTRITLDGMDEVASCLTCNSTGRTLCTSCSGRGWIVCPDCKGRTKKKCTTCRGRGYVADWTTGEKKPFLQKQAENVATSVGERVSDVFESIRQQGVPIPNPVDADPASKGPTVPCPDCVDGEVDCTCGNGKRVCTVCEGTKMSLCANCNGTGKVVRRREIARRFDLNVQTRIVGESIIPQQQLLEASGELVYNTVIDDTFIPNVAPAGVPMDVWNTAATLVNSERDQKQRNTTKPLQENAQSSSRATLQVLELVKVPYTRVNYRYGNQEYVFSAYDSEGREKFYADRYPARWDRIERLVKAISNDLLSTNQSSEPPATNATYGGGYRVPVEVPPYNIVEEDDENSSDKQ